MHRIDTSGEAEITLLTWQRIYFLSYIPDRVTNFMRVVMNVSFIRIYDRMDSEGCSQMSSCMKRRLRGIRCASVHRGLGTHITKCKNTLGEPSQSWSSTIESRRAVALRTQRYLYVDAVCAQKMCRAGEKLRANVERESHSDFVSQRRMPAAYVSTTACAVSPAVWF